MPQNIVGAAADDHAGGLVGHVADDLTCLQKNLKVLIQHRVRRRPHADGGNGEHGIRALFLDAQDVLLSEGGSFRQLRYDLVVKKGELQLFRKPPANFAAAAAVFAADGYDTLHGNSPFVRLIVFLNGNRLFI